MNNLRWTDAQDQALRRAWRTEESAPDVGKRIGRTTAAVYSRAAVLGLPPKTAAKPPGRPPGTPGVRHDPKITAARIAEVMASRPDPVKTQDGKYVARVMAEGGFWAWSEKRGPRGRCICVPPLVGPGTFA